MMLQQPSTVILLPMKTEICDKRMLQQFAQVIFLNFQYRYMFKVYT